MKIVVDDITVDLKVGADPEIFAKENDSLVSAHGMIQGNKENPFPVSKGALQVDGMALEFNINPADNRDEFIGNILQTMQDLKSNMPKGVDYEIVSTAEFGSDYIKQQPIEAQELGCSADYNAYENGAKNPRPNGELPYRTASGHIHLGWTQDAQGTQEHIELCCEVVKLMDLLVGVPSVLLDPDIKRRAMYGQAGAFRPKSYGVEYRVASNFWLKSKNLMAWAYDQSAECIKKYLSGFKVDPEDVIEIRKVINSSDVVGAKRLVSKYGLEVPNA